MACDLEVNTDLIRVLAQRIGDAADTLGAAVRTMGQPGTARGLTAGSAPVREAIRAVAVAEAHSCAATSAVVSRMADVSAGLCFAARAFEVAELLCPGP